MAGRHPHPHQDLRRASSTSAESSHDLDRPRVHRQLQEGRVLPGGDQVSWCDGGERWSPTGAVEGEGCSGARAAYHRGGSVIPPWIGGIPSRFRPELQRHHGTHLGPSEEQGVQFQEGSQQASTVGHGADEDSRGDHRASRHKPGPRLTGLDAAFHPAQGRQHLRYGSGSQTGSGRRQQTGTSGISQKAFVASAAKRPHHGLRRPGVALQESEPRCKNAQVAPQADGVHPGEWRIRRGQINSPTAGAGGVPTDSLGR